LVLEAVTGCNINSDSDHNNNDSTVELDVNQNDDRGNAVTIPQQDDD
jgi:hypothetical protein